MLARVAGIAFVIGGSVGPMPGASASAPGGTAAYAPAPNAPSAQKGPPKPARPALLQASVKFSVAAPATSSGWLLSVVNEGDVPVRILADARLLAFDVTPRSARRSIHCELPTAMRPADDLERALVLPPKREFRETFEPRLYCFGREGFDALAPGAIVTARLGPHVSAFRSAPSEVFPIDGVEPVVAPTRILQAPPIALPDEASLHPAAGHPESPAEALDLPRLKLESPLAIDADSPEAVEVPLTLRNEGSTPVTVRFRPETIGFHVTQPAGALSCFWPVLPTAPTRELFTTLAPRGSVELTVTLQSYCADELFAHSGILEIRPFLETHGASGAPLGLRTFEGRLTGSSITFVRIQHGRVTQPLVRPRAQGP